MKYKAGDIVIVRKNPCGFKKCSVVKITGSLQGLFYQLNKNYFFHKPVYSLENYGPGFLLSKYIAHRANKKEQFLYHIHGVHQSKERIEMKNKMQTICAARRRIHERWKQ